MRARLAGLADLIEVAEAGAEYLRELFVASTVTVSTLHRERYQDLVNVGYLPTGEARYPENCVYPVTLYPETTRRLTVDGGYYTSDEDADLFKEFIEAMPTTDASSVMGVSIVSGGVARGEACLTRGPRQSAFDRADFELARDLATTFGTQLMIAMTRARRYP
jgi:hypothetical protein